MRSDMRAEMSGASLFAGLDGLMTLSRREGVDVRPTLLRVLTDLYVQKSQHTSEEERQFHARRGARQARDLCGHAAIDHAKAFAAAAAASWIATPAVDGNRAAFGALARHAGF